MVYVTFKTQNYKVGVPHPLTNPHSSPAQVHRLPGQRGVPALRKPASTQGPITVETMQQHPPGQPITARLHPAAGEPVAAEQRERPERRSAGGPQRSRTRDPHGPGGRGSQSLRDQSFDTFIPYGGRHLFFFLL